MGSACSAAQVNHTPETSVDKVPRPRKRYCFASVASKESLEEESSALRQCGQEKPSRRSASAATPSRMSVTFVESEPPTSRKSSRDSQLSQEQSLMNMVDAHQTLSLSKLAGPMMDSMRSSQGTSSSTFSESYVLSGATTPTASLGANRRESDQPYDLP